MRESQRDRRRIRPATLAVLRPLFRYSAGRDAYVLRIVGNRFGPGARSGPAGPAGVVERWAPRRRPVVARARQAGAGIRFVSFLADAP